MDELKQELLSKATGIKATPKSTLIQEDIDRWLPLVMGVAGPPSPKYPPFKVPPLPKGRDAINEVLHQLKKMDDGRGRSIHTPDVMSDMERLEEILPDYKIPESVDLTPHGGKIMPKKEYLHGLISSDFEPATTTMFNRVEGSPTIQQWLREFLGGSGEVSVPVNPLSRDIYSPHKIVKAPQGPPDLSDESIQSILRFLAD